MDEWNYFFWLSRVLAARHALEISSNFATLILCPPHRLTVRTFTYQQPAGGVKEGDTFLAPLPSELADGPRLRAPTGQWKDGLFNCFGYGILHPHFCCSLWCTQIAMGQAMKRMNLTWLGVPGAEVATRATFKVVVAIVVSYTVYSIALEIAGAPYGADPPSYISIPRLVGSLAFTVWAIWALMKTRASVRAQYQIPEEKCKGCEDLCCSVLCSCCSVAQILRHTGEYETYHSTCISSTGLQEGAPMCV